MAQVVLADEINRATPKTQSALLECMEERQATIDGVTYPMPSPFLVIATQNPIEYEGAFASRRRSSIGSCSACDWPPKPMEEIVILDEQKRRHPIDSVEQVLGLEELREMQSGIGRSTSTRPWPSTSFGSCGPRDHPDVYLGASRAAR